MYRALPYTLPVINVTPNNNGNVYYTGLVYAYGASGEFVMEQGLQNIIISPVENINKYDVTEALQIELDVRLMNQKIGLIKNTDNSVIIDSSYNASLGSFPIDNVIFSSTEFVLGVSPERIMSLGKYNTLYSDFQNFLLNYFGYPQGFDSLFTIQSRIDFNNGIFDRDSFMNLLRAKVINASGEYVNAITGELRVKHINALLRFANAYNPFNNRTKQTNAIKIDISNGFLENDLLFAPTGTSVTLRVVLKTTDAGNYITLNDAGRNRLNAISGDYNVGYYSQTTTVTETEIVRVLRVPLLLKLTNLSQQNVYVPTEQFFVNFSLQFSTILNPVLDTAIILRENDQQYIIEAIAQSLGVPASSVRIVSYAVVQNTLAVTNKSLEKKSNFAKYRESLMGKMRPVEATYALQIEFEVVITLGELNEYTSSLPGGTVFTSSTDAINDILNTVQYNGNVIQDAVITTFSEHPFEDLITFAPNNTIQGTPLSFGVTNGPGTRGDQGDIGNVGPTGEAGGTGAIGSTGRNGSRGVLGNTGTTGPTGTAGVNGPTGTAGHTGITGITGETGSMGCTGNTGVDGQSGMTGYTGNTGDVGYTGTSGEVGPTGFIGSKGSHGITGETGPTGILLCLWFPLNQWFLWYLCGLLNQ